MTLRKLPKMPVIPRALLRAEWEVPQSVLARWNAGLQARQAENTIAIYDPIGESWDGSGVTAKSVAAALRAIGDNQVTVDINSPGGSVFEGFAIYNLLRDHPRKINVRVIGVAASAASVVAMAGDSIQIAKAGWLMMHNTWTIAIGDRHDMRAMADMMEPFDAALADIYAARSGGDASAIADLLNKETWLGGEQAVEQGFADELLPADQVKESEGDASTGTVSARQMEALLRKAGLSQSQAKKTVSQFAGKRDVAAGPPRDAGVEETVGFIESIAARHRANPLIPI